MKYLHPYSRLHPSDAAHTPKERSIRLPSRLLLQPVIDLLKQLHRPTALSLLGLLSWPHGLFMDADEVNSDLSFVRICASLRGDLDKEVDCPDVVAVEGAFFDVVSGVLVWRVIIQVPLEDVRVECDGCKTISIPG